MAPESLLALGFRCAQTSDTVRGRPPRPRLGRMWTAGNARRSGHGPTTGWRSASRSRQQCRRIQRRCRTGTRPVGADARQHPRSEYGCHVQTRAWRVEAAPLSPTGLISCYPLVPSETPGQRPAIMAVAASAARAIRLPGSKPQPDKLAWQQPRCEHTSVTTNKARWQRQITRRYPANGQIMARRTFDRRDELRRHRQMFALFWPAATMI